MNTSLRLYDVISTPANLAGVFEMCLKKTLMGYPSGLISGRADEEDMPYILYWRFPMIKGQEPDSMALPFDNEAYLWDVKA